MSIGSNSPGNLPLLPYSPSQNKESSTLELIKMALVNNELFRNLDPYCIAHIAEKMEFEEHLDGDVIIPEGSAGNKLCVVEYGHVQVSRAGSPVCFISPGQVFGELALLFRWNHTVTFTASSSPCHLWTLDGTTIEMILKYGWKRHAYVEFMNSLPLFKNLPENKLIRLSWQIGEQDYMPGEYIIRQGTHATNFFVIQRGRVKVTIQENNQENREKFIRVLSTGEFFGERALLDQQPPKVRESQENFLVAQHHCRHPETGVRTANVIVDDQDGVTCLVIDREAFYHFFRGLEQQVAKRYC